LQEKYKAFKAFKKYKTLIKNEDKTTKVFEQVMMKSITQMNL
jgi:hypothetical protein